MFPSFLYQRHRDSADTATFSLADAHESFRIRSVAKVHDPLLYIDLN
jgi:hypothetical protein